MKFVKSEGTKELEQELTRLLDTALEANEHVLWLVPGGSNIATVVAVMNSLDDQNLGYLTLMLTDERYGEPGHEDSNFYQLKQAGLKVKSAVFKDLLTGDSLEETVDAYAKAAEKAMVDADTIIGFFGMGPDGHIAGVLPHSPAVRAKEEWVVGYDGGEFDRMTLTPYALSHVDAAVVGAYGAGKLKALESLCKTAAPMSEQPSRILCHLSNVTVFNDQIGDKP